MSSCLATTSSLGRRPLLRLHLRLHPTMHWLQCKHRPCHEEGQNDQQEESRQACWPLHDTNVGIEDQQRKSSRRGNCPRAEVGCLQRHGHQWWCHQQALVWLPVVPERAIQQVNCTGQSGLCWHVWRRMQLMMTRADGNKVGEGQPTKNNNQLSMGAVQVWGTPVWNKK